MPAGVTRELGPSKSQSLSYETVGNAEDFSPIITNIAPEVTKFLQLFGTAPDAVSTDFSWLTEGLKPPGKNAHFEKEDYQSGKVGSVEGAKNYIQTFINSGYVSDINRKTKKVYNENDEFARQQTKAFTEQANDIEYMLVNNDTANLETASLPPLSGGVPYFMQVSSLSATITVASGVVETKVDHGLLTGDFIYFDAATMPTGLSAGVIYYVRVDSSSPTTKFTIYDTMKDAVENIAANQVKPTAAGTDLKLIKNNVISLGESNDYTLDDINTVMQMAYSRGGNPTEAFMSGAKKRRFSQLATAIATTQRTQKDKKAMQVVSSYESDFGTINAQAHRMYDDKRIDILDLNYWDLKWFDRTHEVKDLAKKGTYKEFVIESRLGLQGTQPKASCSIIGIKR